MSPRERLPFSPITDRPPLALPDGKRLVLWPVLALEEWDIARPMARAVIPPPQGPPIVPDVANWSWHEYGDARRLLAPSSHVHAPRDLANRHRGMSCVSLRLASSHSPCGAHPRHHQRSRRCRRLEWIGDPRLVPDSSSTPSTRLADCRRPFATRATRAPRSAGDQHERDPLRRILVVLEQHQCR
jgi:hypothetical protein